MRKFVLIEAILPVMLATTTLAPAAAFAQAGACFSDWSTAGEVVKSHGLIPVDQLTKLAPSKLGGEIVRIALCEAHDGQDGYVYRLILRELGGGLKTHTLDAKHPFAR
jgi:hypothetical protein